MPSPFDASIAAVFWTGRSVGERSVAEMVNTVKSQAPNVTAILVKSSDGAHWQGHYDATSPGLTVTGPDSLAHWVNVAQAAGLAVHAWCVLNGDDIGGEVQRVLEACAAPGLKSMLLDVEDG